MTVKKRVSQQQQIKKAVAALLQFAMRNFPVRGRLKYLVVLEISEGSKLMLAGGRGEKKSFPPGLYHWWDDSAAGYNPPSSGDEPIATPENSSTQALNELLTSEGRKEFLREARKLVDF